MAFVTTELGAFYVDDIQLLAVSARPYPINRWPEPSSTDAPAGTNVELELTDVVGAGIDLAATQVYIGGVLAFDGGTFQSGWAGAASAYSTPFPETLRIVIDPEEDFDSLEEVEVRVVSDVAGGGFAYDETYSFTVEDLTAPKLVAASARSHMVVRLSFDEAVKQEDAEDPADALYPGNYSFASETVPSVTVTATAVESVSPTSVDVLLDLELTPGALYVVTAANLTDVWGNAIVPPDDTASFAGPYCERPAQRDLSIWNLLPEINRTEDASGDLRRFSDCLQEATDVDILCEADRWPSILDPDLAPENFVDLMLADLGNPFTFELDLVDKRRLLAVLVPAYQQKGTGVGIINLVRFFLGIEVTITEYNGEELGLGDWELGFNWDLAVDTSRARYTFNVNSSVTLTDEQRTRIRELARYMKPAHTHLGLLVEPADEPAPPDHWEMGISELGSESDLH